MDREQYAALTAEDLDWLERMNWGGPQFDEERYYAPGLIRWGFLPTIASVAAPTTAEIQSA